MTDLKAIIFDVYGTLIDIETDEGSDYIYQILACCLVYREINMDRQELKNLYFKFLDEQKRNSPEKYPEIDVMAAWRGILKTKGLEIEKESQQDNLSLFLAEAHRSLALKRLLPYFRVPEVLEKLKKEYRLAIVTDAQRIYAAAELKNLDLYKYFDQVIISVDYGFKKPDRRLFKFALDKLELQPEEAVYVGNDMYHDIFGAGRTGMRTIFYPTTYGRKSYGNTTPDYIIEAFDRLPEAIGLLRKVKT